MKIINSRLKASCQCGKSHFEIDSKAITRFVCHCEVCQKVTRSPHSDVTVVLSKDVILTDISSTQFKRYKAPPNIRRGVCTACNEPSIEFGIMDQLAIIPTKNYKTTEVLPAPAMHVFYHRRVNDIADELPKHEGFITSQLAIVKLVAKGIKQRLSQNR